MQQKRRNRTMNNDTRGQAMIGVYVTLGVLLLALVMGALAYHQVPEGHIGVETEWGAVTGNLNDPGAHFKIPIMQGIQNVETRPRTYTMSDASGEGQKSTKQDAVVVQTVNGTTVRVDVTVRYRVDHTNADEFVSEWNNVDQMEQRLIRPTVRSELRDEAAAIQTSEIYTTNGREALASAAKEALESEFKDEPILLEVVQVRDVDLPQKIDAALDAKEVAKQRVQVEQERIQQERAKAEQKRIQAQADADVIEITGEALRDNPIVLRQRLIEAYGDGTVFVTDGNTPMILDQTGAASGNTTNVPAGPGAP